MKAKNLRIGNYINNASFSSVNPLKHVKVLGVCDEKIRCMEYDGYISSKDCDSLLLYFEPILLDLNWLLKLGFYKSKDKELYTLSYKGVYYYLESIDNNWFFYKFQPLNQYDLKYVHQLQNLFFAITGKELKLKEEISV